MTGFAMMVLAAAAAATPVAEPDVTAQRDGDIVVTGRRTEGSDDYATEAQTTATRLPLSIRETPQSLSVVTRAQIEDFQLNDVNALLTTVPGVTVLAAETDRVYYSARGYEIQTFQIDGVGLPFSFGIQTGSLDTAIYDRVEVVRGAPGLLSPTGNPSAVINFIRKRPYRALRASASAQVGSFNHLRLDGDVSVPLTHDGSIRARAVGAYLDTDSHLDRYGLRRWTGYGIVEADLGPNTVVSAGYAHQDHDSRGAMWGALPLYFTDGGRIPLDRSANTAPDWSTWTVIDRQIFGDLTHEFGAGWTGKLTALRRAISEDDALFYVFGNPDRATGLGVASYPGAFRGETRNLTIDANVGGPVTIGGRQHEVMIGVVRGAEEYLQYSSYDAAAIGVPLPLAALFDGTFAKPAFPTPYELSLDIPTRREAVYGLARLNLADSFKLMIGGSYAHARSNGASYGTPARFDRSRLLPFVGAVLDLSSNLSAYASFTTIFNPQTQFDIDNRLLDPIEGDNLEAGLKGEWFDGRFNASAAIFQARQNNTAESAGFDPVLLRTIFRAVDSKSQGLEFEMSGAPLPGLQVTGGYTLFRLRDEEGDPARTFVPRGVARLNIVYAPPPLPALKVGASIQHQSSFYFEPPAISPTRLTQDGYALVDLLARYDLSETLSLSANLRNVTNVKYLSSLTFDQSFYGAPRSLLATLSVWY